MNIIEVEHLTKDYGHGRGVFDVSFNVQKGEVFGFLGPNGSGKSTTIRHLMGFSRSDKGKTRIFGQETFKNYYKILGNVGYLPGEIALPAGLTGWEFIDMMKKLKNVKDDNYLNYLLKMFNLNPVGETKKMSMGDKRKLAIVTAFINDPDVLILDEPTSSLDLGMQQTFIEFIRNEKQRGKTVLLSSHIFSEVDATCDRIAIIKDGKIISEFIAKDLKHNNNKTYILEFKTAGGLNDFYVRNKNNPNFKIMDTKQNTLLVNIFDENINILIKDLSKSDITGFNHLKETLQDYFMKYYKEDKDFKGAL